MNITKEVAAMERMTVDELQARYVEAFNEATRSRHKQYLVKRIAWRLHANAEGDLSQRARRRAMELANDADLRVTEPRQRKPADSPVSTVTVGSSGELMSGMVLRREYKAQTLRVRVLDKGFEFEGERYKSLTAVAKAITGKHWNGFHFFGLRSCKK